MRLHRLRLTAIGPFRDQVELDFSRLGSSGLFLLEGPTGSGKTTIIDAISFALYGRVAQVSSTGERLRSHHADPRTEPVVELVFETQNGIFRIRRTPTHDRPKRGGAGTTKVQGSIKLWRVTSPDDLDAGEPISTRVAEADDEILRAVGLNHAQFVQTMVLPQGEFANFLRSKTDDKRALLQKLFGTELVAALQQELIDGRRRAELRRAETAAEIGRAAHAFAHIARLEAEAAAALDSAATDGERSEVAVLVGLTVDEFAAADASAVTASRHAKRLRAKAQAALTEAMQWHRKRDRRDALRERQSALQAQLPSIDASRAVLEVAERALTVAGPAEALAVALGRSEQARRAEEAARAALAQLRPAAGAEEFHEFAELATAAEPALRAAVRALQIVLGELAADLDLESKHAVGHLELESLDRHVGALTTAVGAARGALAEFPQRRAVLNAELSTASVIAATESGLRAEQSRAVIRLRAAKQAAAAEKAAARDEQITQAALTAYEDQAERYESLQRSWRASVASTLGQALTAGDPCEVCGSVEHPRPAARKADHVSEDVLSFAQDELGRLRRAVDSARAELDQTRAELADLRAAADKLNPDQAQSRVLELDQAVAAAEAAAAEAIRLRTQLSELDAAERDLGEQLHAADLERAASAQQAEALRAAFASEAERIETARRGYASVAERAAAVLAQAQAAEQAAQVTASAAEALAHALDCGTRFQKALGEAGFVDQQDWQNARRTAAEISELRSALRRFEDHWAEVRGALNEPELTDPALDQPQAELAPLLTQVADAEAAESAAISARAVAQQNLSSVVRLGEALQEAMAAGADILAETAAAIRIGSIAAGGGDNQLSMELTTYVLTRRFADIMRAANTQLRQISGGRYELEHSDSKQGNAKSGLGVRVMDLHTGRTRDPATLSGGETFYVSLSLALGLADVVRAESGGVDLGTLFIDEGFGSLDPAVLDEVLRVLDSLRAGGRVVGVVSHVAEMKARIADQIVIRPNPDGTSTLRLIA